MVTFQLWLFPQPVQNPHLRADLLSTHLLPSGQMLAAKGTQPQATPVLGKENHQNELLDKPQTMTILLCEDLLTRSELRTGTWVQEEGHREMTSYFFAVHSD